MGKHSKSGGSATTPDTDAAAPRDRESRVASHRRASSHTNEMQSMNPMLLRGGALATVAVAGAAFFGAGNAAAVDQDTARTAGNCWFQQGNDDAANHVQTCIVHSNAMDTDVVVQIRASTKQTGEQEQAVYFLDGISAPAYQSTWAYSHVGALSSFSNDYNLVMIAGGAGTWLTDWDDYAKDSDGKPLTTVSGTDYKPGWETFVAQELPTYLKSNFDIDESNNAIVGLSMTGGQAVNLALKYPKLFSVASSISGYYQTDNPVGYFLIPFVQSYTTGIENGYTAMWGDPYGPTSKWSANDVSKRIAQIKSSGQTIIISAGTGIPSVEEMALMLSQGGLANVALGVGLELGSFVSAVILNIQAFIYDIPVKVVYTNGAHDWLHWEANMDSEATAVQDALGKYQVTVPAAAALGTSTTAAQDPAGSTGDPFAAKSAGVEAEAPTIENFSIASNTASSESPDSALKPADLPPVESTPEPTDLPAAESAPTPTPDPTPEQDTDGPETTDTPEPDEPTISNSDPGSVPAEKTAE